MNTFYLDVKYPIDIFWGVNANFLLHKTPTVTTTTTTTTHRHTDIECTNKYLKKGSATTNVTSR